MGSKGQHTSLIADVTNEKEKEELGFLYDTMLEYKELIIHTYIFI